MMTPEQERLLRLLTPEGEWLDEYRGHAIEVGAADGLFTSPTLALEQSRWHVICVEPNPLFAAHAREHRMCVVEAACADFDADSYPFTICNVNHDCRLHEMQGGSSLAVQREHLDRLGWTPKGERVIHVQVQRLDSILWEFGWKKLDFLSIDTEGTEDAVLRGLDFTRFAPKVICVENWPGVNKTDHILLPLGYQKIERIMGNYTDWYVHG